MFANISAPRASSHELDQTTSVKRSTQNPENELRAQVCSIDALSLSQKTIEITTPGALRGLRRGSPEGASKEEAGTSAVISKRLPNEESFESSQASSSRTATDPSQSSISEHHEWQDSIPVPGSRTKRIWLFLPVQRAGTSTEYYERKAGYVIGQLKQAVDNHDKLQDRARFINYETRMVGPTPAEALPSIIVWCHKKDLNGLQSLFESRFLARIQCRSHSRRPRLPLSRTTLPEKPVFWLFYYWGDADPTVRNAGPSFTVKSHSNLTLCGALVVEQHGRRATIGLTLEVDGVDRLLTVEHLFGDETTGVEDSERLADEPLFDDDEDPYYYKAPEAPTVGFESFQDAVDSETTSCDQEGEDIWIYDSEDEDSGNWDVAGLDEDLADDDCVSLDRTEEPKVHIGNLESSATSNSSVGSGKKVQAVGEEQLSVPFLDWALLELNSTDLSRQRRNYIFVKERETEKVNDEDLDEEDWESSSEESFVVERNVLLDEVVASPRLNPTPVLMISGVNGSRTGQMLSGKSYIGSVPGEEMCRAWTVILDPETNPIRLKGVVPGECGSIVVDKKTFKVYGHVVGSNALGHAHVVPLVDTIEQIKMTLNAERVELPVLVVQSSLISLMERSDRVARWWGEPKLPQTTLTIPDAESSRSKECQGIANNSPEHRSSQPSLIPEPDSRTSVPQRFMQGGVSKFEPSSLPPIRKPPFQDDTRTYFDTYFDASKAYMPENTGPPMDDFLEATASSHTGLGQSRGKQVGDTPFSPLSNHLPQRVEVARPPRPDVPIEPSRYELQLDEFMSVMFGHQDDVSNE